MKSFLVGLCILCIVFCVSFGVAFTSISSDKVKVSEVKIITIPPGATVSQVMSQLRNSPLHLLDKIWLRLHPEFQNIKAGAYEVDPSMTLSQTLNKIVDGNVLTHSVTLVEGQTLREWLMQLANAPGLVMDVSYDQIAWRYYDEDKEYLEGFLLPNTYQYNHGSRVSDLLKRAEAAQSILIEELLSKASLPPEIKNAEDWVILASIIEKETGLAEERERIAGVFLNRLRLGMRLQTDPTVIYGIGPNFNGNITRRDLKTKTSHNTYRIDGLPPTPIAAPSEASLTAVLYPDETDDLYFVAKGDGSHHFSKSLAEHNAAVRKYQLNK
jgi:UPF0755 protein